MSQLESWDPKPGTEFGGPFDAIPTSVPGIHVSELLPHTARQMHHLALLRGLHTRDEAHSTGVPLIQHAPKSKVQTSLFGLAGALSGKSNGQPPPEEKKKRRWF